MSGHSFPVDARCECGVAMSFLIRAGAEVAELASEVLRAEITYDVTSHSGPDYKARRQIGAMMAALNMALLRYSAAAHTNGNVGVALGEIEEGQGEVIAWWERECWPYPENARICGAHAATIEPYCTRKRMDVEWRLLTMEDEIGALMNALYGGPEETTA